MPAKKKSKIISKHFLDNVSPFVGLIGFGCWGKNIWRNLCELGVLYTACDSNQNLIVTSNFPKEKVYGLTSQLRRAAISFPSNIAEGAARHSKKNLFSFCIFSRVLYPSLKHN